LTIQRELVMEIDRSRALDGADRSAVPWWQIAIALAAVAAAAVTVWVTWRADFLARPHLLAIQKADFILGPLFVGLYWLRIRPASRFGPILIASGLVAVGYITQSSSNSVLFPIGLLWEWPIYVMTELLILTFPTGRLNGLAPKVILGVGSLTLVPGIVLALVLPQVSGDFSLSGCRALCPENGLAVTTDVPLALHMADAYRVMIVAVALATIVLLIWRFVRGTPPQRRALAIGTPLGLLFLISQFLHQGYRLVAPDAAEPVDLLWVMAVARSLLWYGFWFALIAAQLFAARSLRRLVRQSLRRPSQRELEAMLREPLGDPSLQLAFRDPKSETWIDADGRVQAEPPEPTPGHALTLVEDERQPAVAMVHDAQLNDDPELLQAAGAVALLAAENAELDAAWHDAVQELRRSQMRIVRAGNDERRKLERNLHDGVQQQLAAIRIRLSLARELSPDDAPIRGKLETIDTDLGNAVDALREVSHGLYPPALSQGGLVYALGHIKHHTPAELTIHAEEVGRHPAELESAIYYACVEAIQNATKHGGAGVRITVELRENGGELSFQVTDDGPGFNSSTAQLGAGVQNMRDRVGALDGRLSIVTAPGHGTVVTGTVPLQADKRPRERRSVINNQP
jgi:signal transduction histidine kinase